MGDFCFSLNMLTKDNVKIRRFPIDSPSSTWLSLQYFQLNKDKLPYDAQLIAAKNLVLAARKYDLEVPAEIDTLAKEQFVDPTAVLKESSISKKASPEMDTLLADTEFGLIRIKNGERERLFPMPNADAVTAYASNFSKIASNLEPDDLMTFSYQLRKKALLNGISIDPTIKKLAHLHERKLKKQAKVTILDKYPVDNPKRIKVAAKYFEEFQGVMDPDTKYRYATDLVKTASEQKVDLSKSKELTKFASTGEYNIQGLKDGMALRRRVFEDHNDLESLDTLNKLYKMATVLPPIAFSRTLYIFDTNSGLDYYYNKSVPSPDAILKEASSTEYLSYNNVLADWLVDELNKKIAGKLPPATKPVNVPGVKTNRPDLKVKPR
jgi:hypothetical protein